MEYLDIVRQHCPPEVSESVARAGEPLDEVAGAEPLDEEEKETLLFSEITSAPLTAEGAYGVIGHLSLKMAPERTVIFKINYLALVSQYAATLRSHGDAPAQARLRNDVARAIHSIIDDIAASHLQGAMLAALMAFRIDMRAEIDERVDYKSLTLRTYMSDWLFNEYATGMGDPDGPERLARLFARLEAQDLRNIFSEMKAKHLRGGYCLPPDLIRWLVRPHLGDSRVTADVLGDGPPVSHYARELLDALVQQ